MQLVRVSHSQYDDERGLVPALLQIWERDQRSHHGRKGHRPKQGIR